MNTRAIFTVALSVLSVYSIADIVAFDSASDPTYHINWNGADNGGTGFGNWMITSDDPLTADNFIYTSRYNGFGTNAPNIDTNGKAFGISSWTSGQIQVARPIYATGIQKFSLDFDNGDAKGSAQVALGLRGANGFEVSLGYFGDQSSYRARVQTDTGFTGYNFSIPFTDTGLHIQFIKENDFTLKTVLTDLATSATESFSFTSNSALEFSEFFATSIAGATSVNAPRYEHFFNNLKGETAPVPEPATFAALAVGALALVRRRKQ